MKLHILGCGGYTPTKNHTSCFLLEHKDHLIILDAGTGVSNLRKYKDILDKYDTIHLILTHYHLDHVIGLIYIVPFVRNKKLIIYGPGKPGYDMTTLDYLNQVITYPFFHIIPENLAKEVEIKDYSSGDFNIDDISIKIKLQQHNEPCYRIVIDEMLVYATDTTLDGNLLKECNNGKYLLHECVDINDMKKTTHTSLEVLKRELINNKFEKILLVHQNPVWVDEDYEEIKKQIEGTNFVVPSDFELYEIN